MKNLREDSLTFGSPPPKKGGVRKERKRTKGIESDGKGAERAYAGSKNQSEEKSIGKEVGEVKM